MNGRLGLLGAGALVLSLASAGTGAAAHSSATAARRGGIPPFYRGAAPRATSARCAERRSRWQLWFPSKRAPMPPSRRE